MTDGPDPTLPNAEGAWAQQAEANLGDRRLREEIERGLSFGLEAAPTINDRTISTFVRGEKPHFAGERGTFLKCPFIEDVNEVDDAEVAVFGVPLDAGATYRPGTRFGPQGIRRSTNLFGTYNYESGVDLREQLNMVDIGDVFTIPGNLEKSFDQISQAMAHVVSKGVMPVVLGGDHSIGFPTIRGLTPYLDGNVGIIHFDRHVVPRHQHQERARDQPGTDRYRRLASPPRGGEGRPRAPVDGHHRRRRGTGRCRKDRRDGTRDRLEGRQGRVPILRYRCHRRRLRARHGLAGTRWAAAA